MNLKTISLTLMVGTSMLACNKVSFSPTDVAPDQKMTIPDFPVDPIVSTTTTTSTTSTTTSTTTTTSSTTTTLPPVANPVLKTGMCADQESVASCLKCEVPPAPPVISTKAQKLAKIMAMACQVPNKSYPAGYVPPTAKQIESHLLACTPALYPETLMDSSQAQTIDRLLDENNDGLRQKMFKGIWYQPPHTEHYENYFGLDNTEAAQVFCLNQGTLSNILATKEYLDAYYSDNFSAWQNDRAAQARWNFAQTLRQQLLSCFNKPATPPPPANPPDTKVCQYRSFEGEYEKGGLAEIQRNLNEGYKMAVEANNSCMQLTSEPAPGSLKGQVKIVGYKCL